MSSRTGAHAAPWIAICLVVGTTSAGCKGDAEPAAPAAAPLAIPAIQLPGAPAAGGIAAPSGGSAAAATSSRTTDHAPLATTVTIEFVDRQFYHAGSRNRFIRDVRNTEVARRFTGTNFGIGLVLSARNDSPYLLDSPRVLSDVVIHGAHGDVKCRPELNRYGYPVVGIVSPNVDPRTAWGDESRSFNESPWRPGETIRVAVGLSCATVHMQDIGIANMAGSVRVVGRAIFVENADPCPFPNQYVCGNDVVGTSASLELPGRAIVLQQVQLPGGVSGYSAGDLLIRADAGRVLHENLGTYFASAFTVTGTDLPAQPQFGTETVEEWSMTLTGAAIRPWAALSTTPKGQHVVSVTANLALNAGAIQTRVAAAAAAAADPATPPDPEAIAGDVEGERSRLAGLLACDAVELVTQTRRVRSANGRDAKTSCTALVTQDSVQVSWEFTTDRYEIPLGITYGIDRVPHTTFFANATLATLDPH